MTETTQEERDLLRRRAAQTGSAHLFGCEGQQAFRLLNDADRLAAIERLLRDQKESRDGPYAPGFVHSTEQNIAWAVGWNDCRRAILEAPDAGGEGT